MTSPRNDRLWSLRRAPDGRYALRTDRDVNTGEAWTALDAEGTYLRPCDMEGWEPAGSLLDLIGIAPRPVPAPSMLTHLDRALAAEEAA